ncbi:MAG: hypothetical protein ACRC62_31595 [Microcoleus sp.]
MRSRSHKASDLDRIACSGSYDLQVASRRKKFLPAGVLAARALRLLFLVALLQGRSHLASSDRIG